MEHLFNMLGLWLLVGGLIAILFFGLIGGPK
jgi:hypothetical protein